VEKIYSKNFVLCLLHLCIQSQIWSGGTVCGQLMEVYICSQMERILKSRNWSENIVCKMEVYICSQMERILKSQNWTENNVCSQLVNIVCSQILR
jgi:hypothetical protein